MVKDKRSLIKKKFNQELKNAYDLIKTSNNPVQRISNSKRFLIIELCFLKIYIAWERVLEESFINFICLGDKKSNRKFYSYIHPPSLKKALEIIHEGKPYSYWTFKETKKKADRFLRRGLPFSRILHLWATPLEDMRRLRNRIAHESASSKDAFRTLVMSRSSNGIFPPGLTVGAFLYTLKRGSNETHFQFYVGCLSDMCNQLTR